ncbi:hypothetical protein IV203_035200 [Nitzschia inconspicua]|uniref:Uncharacterized protein n=1 Tax=Nitzschia inconspicua TaxID=303405 RepID=A0A9K3PUQ0_9STRA|nr:hypothetical protein IV203_035200 [Nitzschia inconspicua]
MVSFYLFFGYHLDNDDDNGHILSFAQRSSAFLKGRLASSNKEHRHPRNDELSQDEDGESKSEDLEMGGKSLDFDDSMELKLAEHSVARERGNVAGLGDTSEDFTEGKHKPLQYQFDTSHMIFHKYHKGKSGQVVEEMLMGHAFIFHQNATYGGCCGAKTVKMAAHEELLEAIGLKDVLRFKCPSDFENDHKTRRSIIPRDHYVSEDIRVWTPEYVDYLRSLLVYPPKQHKEKTIVVHMLRGDASPCKPKHEGFYRYLPNFHYQTLITKYMQPDARVIIHTSPKSFEDLSEFRRRGYEVITDAPLKDTWKDFVTADVLIMSRSDFTMVPAMVAKGTVIYTPFWHHSLRRWKRVTKEIMEQTLEETERLRRDVCHLAI